jgi:phasin family protein
MADQKNGRNAPRKPRVVKAGLTDTAIPAVAAGEPVPAEPSIAEQLKSAAKPAIFAASPAPAKSEPTAIDTAARAPQAPEPAKVEAPAPAVEAAQPVEPTIIEPIKTEGAKTMTDAINQTREAAQQTADQIRSAMGNANEQSKAAMEKSARIVEELADLTRGNVEALVASSKTAAKYAETLTQGAADYGRRSFEQASTALKSFAEVKSPTDFFRLQSDYARSAFDQMVAESARVSETMVKMSGDVAEPITSRYSVAAERMKALAA